MSVCLCHLCCIFLNISEGRAKMVMREDTRVCVSPCLDYLPVNSVRLLVNRHEEPWGNQVLRREEWRKV